MEEKKPKRRMINIERDAVTDGYLDKILANSTETITALVKRLIHEEYVFLFPKKKKPNKQ